MGNDEAKLSIKKKKPTRISVKWEELQRDGHLKYLGTLEVIKEKHSQTTQGLIPSFVRLVLYNFFCKREREREKRKGKEKERYEKVGKGVREKLN